MKSSTQTLISALRVLSREIYCEDGAATAVIAEAADRLEAMRMTDEEREAVESAASAFEYDDDNLECGTIAATLRGLLERLK
jgi:hypothetical protein